MTHDELRKDPFVLELKTLGFEEELGGGGCIFLSRYVESGAYVYVTGSDGADMPDASDWMIGYYPPGHDGEELDFLFSSDTGADRDKTLADAIALLEARS